MALHSDPRPPQGPTRTALLVEDEHSTLRFYVAGLKGLQEFKLLSAENGREALELIQKHPVDVVVTDLNMPVLDGYGLIAILSEKYPSLPIIVITSVADKGLLDRAVELGALRVLAKPPKLSVLMEEIRAAVALAPQGVVRGLGLSSLLQLLNWEKKTATLTVLSQGQAGYLYVRDGELIHAACEGDEGLQAAYKVLTWEGVHVEFVGTCRVAQSITLPVTEVLMNSALFRDLRDSAAAQAVDPDLPPTGPRHHPDTWFG